MRIRSILIACSLASLSAIGLATSVLGVTGGGTWPIRF
jgi:hypothetical protein